MTEQVLLSLAWLGGNVLDGLTTYLGIFKVPLSLRSEEFNPLFKKHIYSHFGKVMLFKIIGTVGLLIWIWSWETSSDKILSLRIISIAMGFVVLNNSYIYLSKKIRKKKVMTPGVFLVEICHLPRIIAFLVLAVIISLASYGISVSI